MLAYFEELGQAVDRAWTAAGRQPRALPSVAAEALRARPAPEHTSLADVLSWVACTPHEAFPHQVDLVGVFGDPPITMFHADDFRIDVNVWTTSTTSIHQHGFAGAFQVLHGHSLESRYRFTETREVSRHLRIGDLDLLDMQVRRAGEICEIAPGDAFIHALFHLDHPSATVVVRSHGHTEFQPQLNYDPPGVAYDTALSAAFDELDQRRLQVVSMLTLTRLPEADALLERLFAGAEPLWAYHVLASTLANVVASQGVDFAALEAVVDRWWEVVPWADEALKVALREGARHRVRHWDVRARRTLILEARDRLIAAVLVSAPGREAILACLRRELPDEEPREAVLDFIDRAYLVRDPRQPQVCALGVHVDAVGVLRRMVADDLDFDGVLTVLAREYPDVDLVPQLDGLRERDTQLRRFGLFAGWFSGG